MNLNQYSESSAQPGLSVSKLLKLKMWTPPNLAEQQAIATALSDADAYIESLEQLITKKRQIKQGVMQELLTGKRRLPGFEGEWERVRLGNLGKCVRGVSYNPERDLRAPDSASSVRLLRSNNIQEAELELSNLQFVSSSRVANNQILKTHDVVICMANGSKELVGKAAQFEAMGNVPYTFGAFMASYQPNAQAIYPPLAFFLFQTETYRRHISLLLAGSSINNLTPSSLEACEQRIPLDKEEQVEIAKVLVEMTQEIANLKAKLQKTRHLKQAMMQQLLTGKIRLV